MREEKGRNCGWVTTLSEIIIFPKSAENILRKMSETDARVPFSLFTHQASPSPRSVFFDLFLPLYKLQEECN